MVVYLLGQPYAGYPMLGVQASGSPGAAGLYSNGVVGAASFNSQAAKTVVSGSVSGTMACLMPFGGLTTGATNEYKKVVIYLNALDGSASYTSPVAFGHTPWAMGGVVSQISSLSTTAVTVATTGATSGFLILEGF